MWGIKYLPNYKYTLIKTFHIFLQYIRALKCNNTHYYTKLRNFPLPPLLAIESSRVELFRQGPGKTNKQLGLDSNQLPKITTRLVSFIHIFEQQLYIVIL